MLSTSLPEAKIDFVLITALPEERDAVLAKLPNCQKVLPNQDDIRTYYQADLPVHVANQAIGHYRIVVMCLLGMGRVQAVAATIDAIRKWRPRYLILVGIAGGLATRNVRIGDILISDQIVDYELQKLTSKGPEVRWDVHRADPLLLNSCSSFIRENWQELIQLKRPNKGESKCHIGPIASGDKVIAFGDVLPRYSETWPKLIGVEMEATGVATAAFQSIDKPGFFMIRGVSDLADENKNSRNLKKWREYSCDVVASFTIAFLKSGPISLGNYQSPTTIKQVKIIFERNIFEFSINPQREFINLFAGLLTIDTNYLEILSVDQNANTLSINLPESSAEYLYEMAFKRDFRIIGLGINSLHVQGKEKIDIKTITATNPVKFKLKFDRRVKLSLSLSDDTTLEVTLDFDEKA